MAKRLKGKKHATLTKIDPTILLPKPPAVSQYADDRGAPVTTAIKPTPFSLPGMPPEEPVFFNADTSNFEDGYTEDEISEEDIVGAYYATRVSFPFVFPRQ